MKPLQYRRLAALILVAAAVPACIADADPSMYEDEEELVDETSEAVSTINVALGRPVAVVGQAIGTPARITDGEFAPEHTNWDDLQYAVIVNSTTPASSLVVTLAQIYPVSSLVLQADCNDGYLVEGSTNGSTWRTLKDFGQAPCHGLVTRPGYPVPNTPFAKYIRITPHQLTDTAYSISEIQVFTATADCCSGQYPSAYCPNIICPETY